MAVVRLAIAATRSSPWLSTAVPSAGRASTSSPLARATSSMAPKTSVWARATAVTTPMVGRAIVQRSRMWPTPLAPISITATSVSSAASSSVRGTPSSLLNERRLAAVARDGLVAAAIRSLTEVLPTEPVTPMTAMSPRRSRAWAPSAVRATRVSVTTTAGPSSSCRSTNAAAAPAARAESTKAWPSRSPCRATKSCPGRRARLSIVAPSTTRSGEPTVRPTVTLATSSTVRCTHQLYREPGDEPATRPEPRSPGRPVRRTVGRARRVLRDREARGRGGRPGPLRPRAGRDHPRWRLGAGRRRPGRHRTGRRRAARGPLGHRKRHRPRSRDRAHRDRRDGRRVPAAPRAHG